MFSLHVTVNFDDGREHEWDVEPSDMVQATAVDMVSIILDNNYNATSFVFVVTRK